MPLSHAEMDYGNLKIRPMLLRRGETRDSHEHNFDHTTFPLVGSVHLACNQGELIVSAPTWEVAKRFYDGVAWQSESIFIRAYAVERKGSILSCNAEPFYSLIVAFGGEFELARKDGNGSVVCDSPGSALLLPSRGYTIRTRTPEVIYWRITSGRDAKFLGLKEVSPNIGWGSEAPSHALIRAGVRHAITALEDGTICWCAYSQRDSRGNVIQQDIGFTPAYV